MAADGDGRHVAAADPRGARTSRPCRRTRRCNPSASAACRNQARTSRSRSVRVSRQMPPLAVPPMAAVSISVAPQPLPVSHQVAHATLARDAVPQTTAAESGTRCQRIVSAGVTPSFMLASLSKGSRRNQRFPHFVDMRRLSFIRRQVARAVGLTSVLLGAAMIAMLWSGIVWKYQDQVGNDYREAVQNNDNLTLLFEENVLRSIGEMDRPWSTCAGVLEEQGFAGDLYQLAHQPTVRQRDRHSVLDHRRRRHPARHEPERQAAAARSQRSRALPLPRRPDHR